MSEEPLVSVAILTYNQKFFLKECIESILSQTYKNIEIIVSDDASTDGTQEMLREYKDKYGDKFKLSLSETNQGITNNCNKAMKLCTGKYIAWIGGDDLFLSDKIEKQVKFMECNPKIVLSYHNLDVFNSETNETLYLYNDKQPKLSGNVDLVVEHGTFMGGCSVMVLREKSAPLYNPEISIASDWLYYIETCYNGDIGYIDEVLGRYRRHLNNISLITKYEVIFNEQIKTLDFIDEGKLKDKSVLKKIRAKVYYSYASNIFLNDGIGAKEAIKKSMDIYNFGIKQKILYVIIILNMKLFYKKIKK